eukprot:5032998-Pleurochrysis_carterae.AAC.1
MKSKSQLPYVVIASVRTCRDSAGARASQRVLSHQQGHTDHVAAKSAAAALRITWFYLPDQSQPYHSIRHDAYPGTPLIHAHLGDLVLAGRGSSEKHMSVKDAQGN